MLLRSLLDLGLKLLSELPSAGVKIGIYACWCDSVVDVALGVLCHCVTGVISLGTL